MNAWDVDPNLQLSTYTEIGHKIVMSFNKLKNVLVRRIRLPGRQARVKKQQTTENPTCCVMRYCCITPFKELADNHRLYYPVPHVF